MFLGQSLVDQITGSQSLVQVGSAAYDALVADTLKNPGLGWSHAFAFPTGASSWDVTPGIDFGSGSVMLHVTVFGSWPVSGIVDIAGNEDPTSGFSIQTNTTGDMIGTLRSAGTYQLSLMGNFVTDTWWDACIIIDRVNDEMRFGSIDQEKTLAIPAGTLNSGRAFSIGSGRVTSFIGQVMGARIAFGDQLANVSPQDVCIANAKQVWWDDVYTRVVSAAK